jgi:hypothetical protein
MRKQHAHAETSFDRGFDAPRHCQRDIFLERAAGTPHAAFFATVPGIHHDRPD